jgi:hypothetical protein
MTGRRGVPLRPFLLVFIKEKACSATILTSASLVRVPGSAHMIDDNLRVVTAN